MASWVSRWLRPSSASLGLDIADDALRLVELHQQSGALLLAGAASQPLPPGCVVDGDVAEFDALVDALRQLLQRQPCRARQVAMALPTSAIVFQTWEAPSGLDDEGLGGLARQRAALHWQAAEAPLSLDYGYFSGQLKDQEMARVWLAATRLERVQDRQGLAEACGLQLVCVEDAAQAARRAGPALPGAAGPQPVIALRRGARVTDWPLQSDSYAIACGLALRRFAP